MQNSILLDLGPSGLATDLAMPERQKAPSYIRFHYFCDAFLFWIDTFLSIHIRPTKAYPVPVPNWLGLHLGGEKCNFKKLSNLMANFFMQKYAEFLLWDLPLPSDLPGEFWAQWASTCGKRYLISAPKCQNLVHCILQNWDIGLWSVWYTFQLIFSYQSATKAMLSGHKWLCGLFQASSM